MSSLCPECGAPIPEGGSCRDHFDALLLLEWQLTGIPDSLSHFYAVSTYCLQHPDSMNQTAEALNGLRERIADALDGKATLHELLIRTRRFAEGAVRVTRRPGDPPLSWRRGAWPMTIADVLTVTPEAEAYAQRVAAWARSVCETLDTDQSS
jgi:hypothetical protein